MYEGTVVFELEWRLRGRHDCGPFLKVDKRRRLIDGGDKEKRDQTRYINSASQQVSRNILPLARMVDVQKKKK